MAEQGGDHLMGGMQQGGALIGWGVEYLRLGIRGHFVIDGQDVDCSFVALSRKKREKE